MPHEFIWEKDTDIEIIEESDLKNDPDFIPDNEFPCND